jgi:F-type H+-transporting ATPase subunit b
MSTILLASEATQSGLLGALGINWRSLLLNTLAFFVILAILRRFVYPVLSRALDAKQDELQAAAKAETEAKKRLEDATAKAESLIAEARASAEDVISTARTEATGLVDEAANKAKAQAGRIVDEAHEQLRVDVDKARHELAAETARLVAQVASTVLGEKLDDKGDAALVERSLKGSRS